MESKIIFGQMLDHYRKERNLTMEDLGKIFGKTTSTISRWISGERSPKMAEVELIAEYFNIDVETLVFGGNLKSHIGDIVEIVKKLPLERQAKVLDYAKFQLLESEQEA